MVQLVLFFCMLSGFFVLYGADGDERFEVELYDSQNPKTGELSGAAVTDKKSDLSVSERKKLYYQRNREAILKKLQKQRDAKKAGKDKKMPKIQGALSTAEYNKRYYQMHKDSILAKMAEDRKKSDVFSVIPEAEIVGSKRERDFSDLESLEIADDSDARSVGSLEHLIVSSTAKKYRVSEKTEEQREIDRLVYNQNQAARQRKRYSALKDTINEERQARYFENHHGASKSGGTRRQPLRDQSKK